MAMKIKNNSSSGNGLKPDGMTNVDHLSLGL